MFWPSGRYYALPNLGPSSLSDALDSGLATSPHTPHATSPLTDDLSAQHFNRHGTTIAHPADRCNSRYPTTNKNIKRTQRFVTSDASRDGRSTPGSRKLSASSLSRNPGELLSHHESAPR